MRGLRPAIPVIRPSTITGQAIARGDDRIIRIRPKTKPGSSRTGLCGEEGGPARARRRAWFVAREAGIEERLADRQLRRSRPICRRRGRLRRDCEDKGNDAPPAIPARCERAKQYFLPIEPLSEPVPRAEVEVGIARRRTRRIDAGDFEPDAVFESQFEPLVDRDDPGAGAALARAKAVRRAQAARGRKRNHGPGEKNGEAQGRPGAKAE
jgi:hypothetical protein